MPVHPILRFAPSPNGWLHAGHAYSALFTWDMADRLGGTALLRIEDIDLARCRPDYVAGIFEDLSWLGLCWPEPVLHQSGRFDAYGTAAGRLREMGLLYPCFCSRREVARDAHARDPDGAPRYGGRCRALGVTERADRLAEGSPHCWRIDMDAALEVTGTIGLTDFDIKRNRTERVADPGRWGDAVLIRRDVPASYHLAVVVDDAFQNVTHVTRGMDLHAATDLHRLLQTLLGLPAPLYCHHELIRDAGDIKLSKSRGSTSLRDLRAKGWTGARLRDHLGFPGER